MLYGTHATALANSVYNAIGRRSTVERRATLHIFAAAPNAFMFFLGQNSVGFECEELYDSVCKWRELFGNEFPPAPKPSKSNSSTGFTTRTEKSAAIPEGRFA